jgi:hypothetical protein
MCIPLGPIMIDHNVCDLLVPKSLISLNILNHMIGPPWFMVKKIYGSSLKSCMLLPQFVNCLLLLGLCHCMWIFSGQSWFYLYALSKMSMIISFLPNGDLKYSYVFPLMTNVILRISHKECYWAYSSYKDLLLRWTIVQ